MFYLFLRNTCSLNYKILKIFLFFFFLQKKSVFKTNIFSYIMFAVLCLVSQSCPTLRDPMDCSLPGSSVHGDSLGKHTGVGCHVLLQGIFPIQGSNPGLPPCRWFFTVWANREAHEYWRGCSIPSPGEFTDPGIEPGLLHCRWIL